MKDISIRTATMADLEILLQFEQGVISAERPFDETLKPDTIHYYDLPMLISSPEAEVVVAESGGAVIGSGYARLETAKPYLQHASYAYLGFMYVLPEYRGRGINQMILDTLQQWVASKGITELRLEVYAGNLPAIKAYEKAGFQPLLVLMRTDISGK